MENSADWTIVFEQKDRFGCVLGSWAKVRQFTQRSATDYLKRIGQQWLVVNPGRVQSDATSGRYRLWSVQADGCVFMATAFHDHKEAKRTAIVHQPGDSYIITGQDRTGKRFKAIHTDNLAYATGINLYNGAVWRVRNGKRKLLYRVYN